MLHSSQHSVFDLRSLICEVAAWHRSLAQEQGIDFVVEHESQQALLVLGDRRRVGQILSRLATNAVAATSEGAVRFAVDTEIRAAGECALTVVVRDSSAGIPPEKLDRMFILEPSSLAESPADDPAGGWETCRSLARHLGARLGVTSVLGKGSTYVFQLKLSLDTTASDTGPDDVADARGSAHDGEFPPGLRVLLVEDNPVNRKLAVRSLEKVGCVVDTAENGQEGVRMFVRGDYAAVFMDCQMPIMDGYQATHAIRVVEGNSRRVPIIAVTANALAGDRELCLAAGMDDYIAKPLRPRDLHDALRRWCRTPELVPA